MATRYFNWKLAIVLVVAAAVFVVAAFALRRWQRSTRAEQALPRGQKAYEAKDWDEAARQFGSYLAINNQDVPVLIRYAEAQMNRRPSSRGNLQQAVAAYRTVLRLKPDDVETAKRFTDLHLQLGDAGEARQIAQRCLERRDDPTLRCMLGAALWSLRDFSQATTELKKVIEKYPAEIQAYESLGRMAEDRAEATGQPAAAWFDEAVAKNPESALAYAARAAHRLRSNDPNNKNSALADLARATQCDLSDKLVRLRVIEEFMNVGAWEKAREQLRALQAASPAEPALWSAWAKLAIRVGSKDEMYMIAEEGMKALGTQVWDFLPTATQLLILSDHLEKVEEYLTQMRNKGVESMHVAYLDGLLAEKQGRLRDAVRYWQQAIALTQADYPNRVPVEAYMRLATTIVRLGDIQSAITQLQTLLSKRPDVVNAQLLLAQLYAQARDWQRTLDQARRVQEIARNQSAILAEAQLLELRAQTQMLGESGAPDTNQAAWDDLGTRLAALDKATGGALAVKLLQVQVAMTRQKLPETSTLLSELESKYPADVRVMLLRAELATAEGKDAEARRSFQNAIAKFPQTIEPVRGLAIFLDRHNQRQECEVTIKEAFLRIQEAQPRRDLGLLLAEFYYRWEEKEKLCQWLTDLTAQFPYDIQSRRLLLVCDAVMQDAARSRKIVDEIKAIEGENGTQWRYEQARLLIRSPEFRDAAKAAPKTLSGLPVYRQIVKLLQENLSINPDDQVSRLLLAGVYEASLDQQLALTTYREAYVRTPNDSQVLVRFVAALHKAEQFDEAQSILEKLGQQDLLHPDLQRLQVDYDVRSGDLAAASNTLQQLIERDPNDAMLRLSYARVLSLRGRFPEAEAILNDLQAKMPDSILVSRAQIRLYLQKGDTAKAMTLCNDVVNRQKNTAAHLMRAEVYITLKENDKALQDLGQAIALEPQNPDTWEARARVYSSLGRISEAISDARRALVLAPQERRIQKFAAMLFIMSGKTSLLREAENMLDQALGDPSHPQDQADPDLGLLKARILVLRATGPTIEQARTLLREITAAHPKYVEAWELMAQLELQQEEPGRALDVSTRGLAYNEKSKQLLLLKAIAEKRISPSVAALTTLPMLAEQYPDDVGIVIEWADAHARAGRPQKAVELLSQKLADFEGAARRRCEIALAAALYTDQQREKAQAMFETLIAAEPNDPTPVMTLGQLLRKEKRWTEVNQLVNLWRNTNPKDAETATNMARILAGSGDREALRMAEDQLRMVLDQNPDSVPTLVLLGMLMQDAGRTAEATRLNRRILELDPNNVIAINNLAWMLCEDPASTPEVVQGALELANRGLVDVPEYMDLLDTRGVIYYRLGNMQKAEADFVKCLGLFPANSPQSAAPQFHLARAYADMNRRTQAVEHLKEALNLNGKNVELAKEHADAGRYTHAIKVLRDALALQDQMDKFKTGFDQQDLAAGVRSTIDWTAARTQLEQLQRGR